jgi:hypothetical protein
VNNTGNTAQGTKGINGCDKPIAHADSQDNKWN